MKITTSLSSIKLGQLFRFQSGNLNPQLKIRSGYLDIKSGIWKSVTSTSLSQKVILLDKLEVCNELNVTIEKLTYYIRNQIGYNK